MLGLGSLAFIQRGAGIRKKQESIIAISIYHYSQRKSLQIISIDKVQHHLGL